MEIILKNVDETRTWAKKLAKAIRAENSPVCVALHGDLGMGKSEIARAVIQELCGADTVVPSPTFTLVQSYQCGVDKEETQHSTLHISHFDLYRITDPSELEEIGLSHAMANDITLIEWPEIAGDKLSADTVHVYITEHNGGRKIEIKNLSI